MQNVMMKSQMFAIGKTLAAEETFEIKFWSALDRLGIGN